MEEMGSARLNANNPALSFKKMRSSNNINGYSSNSTSPLKPNANNFNFQTDDRSTANVLRETKNVPFFREKYVNQ